MGSYLTIVNHTNETNSVKLGCDTAALFIGTTVAGAIACVISAGSMTAVVAGTIITIGTGISVGSAITSIGVGVHKHLNKDGFITLKPGERHQYGKMSLSLWQQCTCVRTR